VEVSPSAILEEIIDPLMMGDLAASSPSIELHRLTANSILLDFGQPDAVYVVTVEERARS
jgi:hypothetical protein